MNQKEMATFTVHASQVSTIIGLASYAKPEDILVMGYRILSQSGIVTPLLPRTPDELDVQFEDIIKSEEYANVMDEMIELASHEIVEVISTVRIIKRHDDVTIQSTTTTQSSVPPPRLSGPFTTPFLIRTDQLEPKLLGRVIRTMKLESGLLLGHDERVYSKSFGSKLTIQGKVDGYRNGVMVQLKSRSKAFRIRSGWGMPKYDLVHLAILLEITGRDKIILEEYHKGETRYQVFTSEELAGVKGYTVMDMIVKLIEVLEDLTRHVDLFTPEIIERARQLDDF